MSNILLRLFVKDHKNTGDPGVRAATGRLAGAVGIVCNLLLAVLKLIVGVLSGAVSVMADAMNNLSDAASSIVTLIGFKLSEKPADSEHPYGHARFEYLSGLAVAGLILVIGFELAKTSVEKIFDPGPVAVTLPFLIVLVGSVLGKLWLWAFNRKLGNRVASQTLLATAADCRNDVIATLAVLAAALTEYFTGWYIDGYVGLAVAIFILLSGISLAKQTVSPLLGEAASPELRALIIEVMQSNCRVLGWHDLMVHDYGPGQRFASIHVEMDQREDPLVCHEIIDDMERLCYQKHKIHLVIHYDPVVTDDPEMEALRQSVCSWLRELEQSLSVHDFRMVRGTGHSNLIFDVAMPHSMAHRKNEVKAYLDSKLQDAHGDHYNTVITFDLVD